MIGWFLSTSMGRTTAAVVGIVAAFGMAVFFGQWSGARRLRNKIDRANLELEREYRDVQNNTRTDRISVVDRMRRGDF